MSLGWGSLPLLPLRNILELLSLEDALSAMSVSRHWRDGLLMYEGNKKILKLHAKQLEKSVFLARIFKKHVQVLIVNVASCNHDDLNSFMNKVMPQFFDTLKLQEALFIGSGCVQQTAHTNVKLDRIITESLVFKHSHSIHTFAMMNCEQDTHYKKKDKDVHCNVENYSRALRFEEPSPADVVLSRHNAEAMMFSSLQHIIVDYSQITIETLQTLSHLTCFSQLSVILCHKMAPHAVDWRRAMACYPNGLDVAVNIISLPPRKIDEVIDIVLVEELPLTSLKVMFCKTVHVGLINHIVRVYKSSLREVVIADAPHEGSQRVDRSPKTAKFGTCNVNPIILMCWQCTQLRRLVIHGYWIQQYDIIGFVRLRKSLEQLDVSCVCGHGAHHQASLDRVLSAHRDPAAEAALVEAVNVYTKFEWKPTPWSELHPALRVRASPAERSDYVVRETRAPLGLTRKTSTAGHRPPPRRATLTAPVPLASNAFPRPGCIVKIKTA